MRERRKRTRTKNKSSVIKKFSPSYLQVRRYGGVFLLHDKKSLIIKENIKGGIIGTLAFIIETIFIVIIAMKSSMDQKMYLPTLIVCILISGLISGFAGTVNIKKSGLKNGFISSIIPSIMILISLCLFSKCICIGNILSVFIVIFGGLTGGILAVNIKRKSKIKR